MKRNIFIIIILILITSMALYSKKKISNNNFNSKWGIGIIRTKNVKDDKEGFFPGYVFTERKINLYNKPNGKKIGYMYKRGLEIFYNLNNKNKKQKNDTTEIGYHEHYLKYYKKNNNYIQILYKSTGKEYWISIKELKKVSYYLVSWKKFFKNNDFQYFILPKGGMNLRSKPSKKGKKILLIKDTKKSYFYVNLTKNFSGLWAEVVIEEQEPDDCGEGKIKKKYKGWIKILDSKIYPNIWYNPRGC